MTPSFHLYITIPGKVVADQEASSLIVPAEKGYLGVLAHHAPIIARLKPGTITIRTAGDTTSSFKLNTGGFLEFSDNRATLILDSIELPA